MDPVKKGLSFEDSTETPLPPTAPCSDCPWQRDALPGWLGQKTADEFIQDAHGEFLIDCHTLRRPGSVPGHDHWQCAGSAIYRGNVAKSPRRRDLLVLPADRERVFGGPKEFLDYHKVRRR